MADIDSNLPVKDTSDGTPGSAAPAVAQQVGGTDGTNLRAFRTDSSGRIEIDTAQSLPLPSGASTSANQTNGSQKTQVVDGSGNVVAELSNSLNVNFISNGSGSQAALTVGTSAVLVNCSGSNLTNRVNVTLYNNSALIFYWGYTNAVTSSTGIPIAPGQSWTWNAGASTNVYVITTSSSQNGRVAECAR